MTTDPIKLLNEIETDSEGRKKLLMVIDWIGFAHQPDRELAAVDDRLARRPAIAGLSRLFAIEWACSEAGKADKLQAEVARLRALLDEVREILPELIECVEENTNDWPIAKAANAVLAKLEGGRG
jgi:lipopolysaccharide biosynthesis regulator YciM